MSYDKIRTALGRGIFVDNLRAIARLAHEMLKDDESVKHPAVPLMLASIADGIARRLEGEAVPAEIAKLLESHLLPKLVALVDTANADGHSVANGLDEAARAYIDSISIV